MLFNVFSDAEKFSDLLKVMLTGILPTVRIFGFTILLSIPLGILLAAGRVSKVKILRMPISVYIYLIRSTPLMLQLLFSYFLLSRLEWSPVLRFLFGDKRGSFPSPCRRGRGKRPRCWAIRACSRFSACSCRRSSKT